MDEATACELLDESALRTDRVLPNQGPRTETWAGFILRNLPFSPSQVVRVVARDQNPSSHRPAESSHQKPFRISASAYTLHPRSSQPPLHPSALV